MKPFRILTTLCCTALLTAQESGHVSFDLKPVTRPITIEEIVIVVAFIAFVAGGVFLLIRRRTDETPKMSLDD